MRPGWIIICRVLVWQDVCMDECVDDLAGCMAEWAGIGQTDGRPVPCLVSVVVSVAGEGGRRKLP